MRTKLLMLIASIACFTLGCSKKENPVKPGNTGRPKQGNWTPGQPLVNGTYTIINIKSGKSLDVINGSSANGALLQQWSYISPNLIFPNAQKWTITSLGSGYYKVINVNSNKSVDVPNGVTTNGQQLQQWDYIGFNSQIWKIENVGFDLYKFTNKASGKVMTVKNGSTANGAQVVQYPDSSNHQSQWFQIRQVAYKDIAATNFFRRTSGVISMDQAASIPLSDSRVMWAFGDTGLGPVDPVTGLGNCTGGTGIFGNTGIMQPYNNWDWTQSASMLGPGNTAFFVSDPSPVFNWPNSGFQIADTVYITYNINGLSGPQPTVLAKFKFPGMTLAGKRYISQYNGINFGSVIKAPDGYIYMYGGKAIPPYNVTMNVYVARIPQSNLSAPLNFWNGTNSTWTTNASLMTVVVPNVNIAQFSPCVINGRYVAFSAEFSVPPTVQSGNCDLGTSGLLVASSSSPTGPFSAFKTFYNIEDRKQGIIPWFYSCIGHPEYINSNNEILVTYCTNHYHPCIPDCVNGHTDPDEYRPKAVRVPLSMIDPAFN